MKSRIFSLLNTCLALALAAPLQAQVLEEVVVTAQKREQDLSDVGISITAFSGDQLKELGFTNTTQFDEQIPGLIVSDYGGGVTTVFTIRGSGQLDFADQQEPPVAVYTDGAYNSFLAGVGFNFFDVERIEVLRGSQGTLFGRNATGGLVHVISNKPSQENEGHIELTAGEYEKIRVEGVVNGGLTETLAGRISVAYENDDGFQETRGPGENSQAIDNFSGRAQLLWEPTDRSSILANFRYSTDDTGGQIYHASASLLDALGTSGLPGSGEILKSGTGSFTPQQFVDWCNNDGALVFGMIVNPALGGANCSGDIENADPFDVTANTEGFYKRDHAGLTLTIEHEMQGGMTITSITDYQYFRKDYLEDTDSTNSQLFDFFQNMDSDQVSQEIRLAAESDRLKWVVGGYFLNIDSIYDVGVDGVGAFGLYIDNNYTLDTTTYAGFIQLEYDINDQFTAIGGFRWTEDEKDYEFVPEIGFTLGGADRSTFFAGLVLGGLVGGDGLPPTSRSEGDWSGHIELDWKPNEDWLVYGKVSRGHKAGGFNGGGTAFFTAAEATYDAELPITYEAGFKSSFADGRYRLNASGFYIDYDDFQTFTQDGLSLLLFNVDAEVTGAEFELIANPFEGFEMLLGLSLLDAEQKDLAGFDGVRDRPMPNAPDVSFNGLARYQWPMMNGAMAVQFDWNYVDKRSLNAIDHEALIGDSYWVANAKLGWTSEDGKWHADVWVKNLFDEEYFPTLFDLSTISGSLIEVPAPPRWFGGTVRYSW